MNLKYQIDNSVEIFLRNSMWVSLRDFMYNSSWYSAREPIYETVRNQMCGSINNKIKSYDFSI